MILMPAIRYTTGASAVFGHRRIGRKGKEFTCLKFRTMVANADEVLKRLLDNDPDARVAWSKDFKLRHDPRITRIGSFLRKTSLDELPQLWNVLRGDMSLIGPRPIVEDELSRYEENVGYYLEVRPGMTGLWQVSGRNNVSYDTRVYLDTWYVKNWTLWYDVVVLLKTLKVVFGDKSAY
jgi:undecaprenyl-phosphate galactose phosphotransferase